jgi:hypothetical protein
MARLTCATPAWQGTRAGILELIRVQMNWSKKWNWALGFEAERRWRSELAEGLLENGV